MGPLCGDFKPSQQVDHVTHRLTNQSLYLNQQYISYRSVTNILYSSIVCCEYVTNFRIFVKYSTQQTIEEYSILVTLL